MNTKIDDAKMVYRLLFLRGLSIIAVVMGHANGWAFTAMFWWTDRYRSVSVPNYDQIGSFSYYGIRVMEQLTVFCVPAFIFISGYFMARSAGDESASWNTIIKRIKRLVPPYLLWSIIIMIFQILQGDSLSLLDFIRNILTGSAIDEYYFPVLLIQFYLISPFIVPLARTKWKPLLVISGLINAFLIIIRYLALLGIDFPLQDILIFISQSHFLFKHLIWFTLGLVTYYQFDILKAFLERNRLALIIGLVITFVMGILEWELILQLSGEDWILFSITIIDTLYTALVILTFIAVTGNTTFGSNFVTHVGNKSYGIYLVHPIIITIIARLIYHLVPMILAYQLVFYTIIVFTGLIIPILMMKLTTMLPMNRYYELAFGRR